MHEPVNYGIHLLRISTPFQVGKVNIYFIEDPEPSLIDVPPNGERYINELDEALKEMGYSIDKIKRIIITHPHFDHFGSASRIAGKSGSQIYIFSKGARWLEDFENEFKDDDLFYIDFLQRAGVPRELANYSSELYRRAKKYGCQIKPSVYLSDGDTIKFSSFQFQVISVPGHTPWCIALYEPKYGIFFSGDFLIKDISSNAIVQRPWVVPKGYKSLKTYISSLNMVKSLNIKTALPGHRELIDNPKERIEEILLLIKARKQEILQILIKKGTTTPYEIMKELFPDLPDEQVFLGISEIVGYLELLEEEGLATRKEKRLMYFSPST